jgi:hypothetical protein
MNGAGTLKAIIHLQTLMDGPPVPVIGILNPLDTGGAIPIVGV